MFEMVKKRSFAFIKRALLFGCTENTFWHIFVDKNIHLISFIFRYTWYKQVWNSDPLSERLKLVCSEMFFMFLLVLNKDLGTDMRWSSTTPESISQAENC